MKIVDQFIASLQLKGKSSFKDRRTQKNKKQIAGRLDLLLLINNKKESDFLFI